MNGDGATGFDDHGQAVPAVDFDLDVVEEHLDGPTNAGGRKTLVQRVREATDAELASMLETALAAARTQGWEEGREHGRKERQQERQTLQDAARRDMLQAILQGEPTPIHAWRRLHRLAFWLRALPGFDTQKKLAEKLGCTRSAIGQQLAKEILRFTRETEDADSAANLPSA
jgi:hypothetical protein